MRRSFELLRVIIEDTRELLNKYIKLLPLSIDWRVAYHFCSPCIFLFLLYNLVDIYLRFPELLIESYELESLRMWHYIIVVLFLCWVWLPYMLVTLLDSDSKSVFIIAVLAVILYRYWILCSLPYLYDDWPTGTSRPVLLIGWMPWVDYLSFGSFAVELAYCFLYCIHSLGYYLGCLECIVFYNLGMSEYLRPVTDVMGKMQLETDELEMETDTISIYKRSFNILHVTYMSDTYVSFYFGFVIAIAISAILILASYILAAQHPYDEKAKGYECGFDPFSDAREPFAVKFYLVAILFILFEIELLFFFPWALCLRYTWCIGFIYMYAFFVTLSLTFLYEWIKRSLEW